MLVSKCLYCLGNMLGLGSYKHNKLKLKKNILGKVEKWSKEAKQKNA